MTTELIPQCQCPTCTDPRQAIIADLLDQCGCTAERICSACHALGMLTDRRRCRDCRTWTDAGLMTAAGGGEHLCDGCWESYRDAGEGWWDGSDD